MDRRSFIKRTALAVGIGLAAKNIASAPKKVKSLKAVVSGQSLDFDLNHFTLLFESDRNWQDGRFGPPQETLTITTKDAYQTEQKLVSLTPIEAYMDGGKVTVSGEFYEINNRKKIVTVGVYDRHNHL